MTTFKISDTALTPNEILQTTDISSYGIRPQGTVAVDIFTNEMFLSDGIQWNLISGGGGSNIPDGTNDGDIPIWNETKNEWETGPNPGAVIPDGNDPGDVPIWNGTEWTTGTPPGGAVETAEPLTGNGSSVTPITLQNATSMGQLLSWNSTDTKWESKMNYPYEVTAGAGGQYPNVASAVTDGYFKIFIVGDCTDGAFTVTGPTFDIGVGDGVTWTVNGTISLDLNPGPNIVASVNILGAGLGTLIYDTGAPNAPLLQNTSATVFYSSFFSHMFIWNNQTTNDNQRITLGNFLIDFGQCFFRNMEGTDGCGLDIPDVNISGSNTQGLGSFVHDSIFFVRGTNALIASGANIANVTIDNLDVDGITSGVFTDPIIYTDTDRWASFSNGTVANNLIVHTNGGVIQLQNASLSNCEIKPWSISSPFSIVSCGLNLLDQSVISNIHSVESSFLTVPDGGNIRISSCVLGGSFDFNLTDDLTRIHVEGCSLIGAPETEVRIFGPSADAIFYGLNTIFIGVRIYGDSGSNIPNVHFSNSAFADSFTLAAGDPISFFEKVSLNYCHLAGANSILYQDTSTKPSPPPPPISATMILSLPKFTNCLFSSTIPNVILGQYGVLNKCTFLGGITINQDSENISFKNCSFAPVGLQQIYSHSNVVNITYDQCNFDNVYLQLTERNSVRSCDIQNNNSTIELLSTAVEALFSNNRFPDGVTFVSNFSGVIPDLSGEAAALFAAFEYDVIGSDLAASGLPGDFFAGGSRFDQPLNPFTVASSMVIEMRTDVTDNDDIANRILIVGPVHTTAPGQPPAYGVQASNLSLADDYKWRFGILPDITTTIESGPSTRYAVIAFKVYSNGDVECFVDGNSVGILTSAMTGEFTVAVTGSYVIVPHVQTILFNTNDMTYAANYSSNNAEYIPPEDFPLYIGNIMIPSSVVQHPSSTGNIVV